MAASSARKPGWPIRCRQARLGSLGTQLEGRLPISDVPEPTKPHVTTPFDGVSENTPASRSVLQAVVDRAPVGFALLDGGARCRYANEEFASLVDHRAVRPIGERLDTVWSGIADQWEGAFQRALVGETVRVELTATNGEPRLISTLWYPVRPDEGGSTGRVGLFTLDISERAEAERALARSAADIAALQELSLSLTAARRPADVAEAVESWCAETLGRIWVKIALVDRASNELRFLGGTSRPNESRAIPMAKGHPVCDAVLADEPIVIGSQDEMSARYGELAATGEEGPIAAIPLPADDGAPVGVLIARADGGSFEPRERGLLSAMGASAGQALARTRADEATRAIAKVLQESLAPPRLDPPAWCDIDLRFEATGAGVEVGGDFYDLFEAGGHWFLLVGDACGKGPRAAVLAATVRRQARWLARAVESPAELLARLNAELISMSGEEDHRFVTAACASLSRDDGGVEALVARAGHPHPLVRRGNGEIELLDTSGTLLGVESRVKIEQKIVRLQPGDALVMFTDGLTEARDPTGVEFGEQRIRQTLARSQAGSAGDLVAAVVDAAATFVGGPLTDDLAVVVATPRDPEGGAGSSP